MEGWESTKGINERRKKKKQKMAENVYSSGKAESTRKAGTGRKAAGGRRKV